MAVVWQGGRTGFGADEFHCRGSCTNTLTLIRDTDGNMLGHFTPLEQESREWN
jgi:hypothetical protein